MTGKIRIGETTDGKPVHVSLKDLIHLLFTASSGFGKTTGLRLILERTHGLLPHIVIDREGEFQTLRTDHDYVLIGPNGDRPLDPRAAAVLPRHIMERGFSVIIDLSEVKPHVRHAYVRDLYEGLQELPRELWKDYLLVHDEAHTDMPEGGKRGERPACADAIADGFSLFRKRGGHILAATQRLAKFDKDGAAECEAKIVGRCNLSDDQERALKELGERSNKDMGQLIGRLQPGQVILLGRAFGLERPTVVQLDMPKTRAPPRGKGAQAPPAPRAEILKILDELQDLPQEAERKARTEAELRAELANVRRELTLAKKAQPPPQPVKIVKMKEMAVSKAAVAEAARAHDKLRLLVQRVIPAAREVLDRADKATARLEADLAKVQAPTAPPSAPRPAPPPVPRPVATAPGPSTNGHTEASGDLPKGERAILTAVAQHEAGVTREQLTVLTGYKRSSRDTYLQRLRERGHVDHNGDRIVATQAGVDALGSRFEPLPKGQALRDHWLRRLPEGERRILEHVIAHPDGIQREALSEKTGYKRSSRDTYIQRLSARELVEARRDGTVAPSPTLFEEATA